VINNCQSVFVGLHGNKSPVKAYAENFVTTVVEYFDLLSVAHSYPGVSESHPLNVLPSDLPFLKVTPCH
jgi:hypothetical protein